MDKKYYVSSLAFLGLPIEEIIDVCSKNHFNLEFSSGIPFQENMENVYLDSILHRMSHNYFPAPEVPFVLNLASKNEEIRAKSIQHCKNGLELSKKSNSPFFAAHAGFCIDPNPEELGQKISFSNDFDIKYHQEIFRNSVLELLDFAERLQIDFLIENNVLAPFNFDKVNPLLCSDSKGISEFFEEMNHPKLGLLLDTAHLKVSCNTLQLDLEMELRKVVKYVKAIHHSDNNGEIDDNKPISKDYWFLQFQEDFNSMVHVLEVKNQSVSEINRQIALLQGFGN